MYETYVKVIKIEANTMIHMAAKHYIPAVIHYTTRLGQSIQAVTAANPSADVSVQSNLLGKVSSLLADASAALEQLEPLMERVDAIQDISEMAHVYHDAVVPAMAALRHPIDQLELLVDKDIWPVPTYGDLMFEV
jgi:glutamine synthetase